MPWDSVGLGNCISSQGSVFGKLERAPFPSQFTLGWHECSSKPGNFMYLMEICELSRVMRSHFHLPVRGLVQHKQGGPEHTNVPVIAGSQEASNPEYINATSRKAAVDRLKRH